MTLNINYFTRTTRTQEKHKNKKESKQVILISKPRCLTRFIQGSIYRVLGVKEAKNRWDTRIKQGVCKLCQVDAPKVKITCDQFHLQYCSDNLDQITP